MPRAKPDDAVWCRVVGCQRWSRKWDNFICGTHWKRLTAVERKTWGRIRRLCNRGLVDWSSWRVERVWQALIRRAGL